MKKEQAIQDALQQHFPAERLKTRLIDRHAYSSDAGFYTLVPQAVVYPTTVEEVRLLFQLAKAHRTAVTFRTAGTSLSGQSVTEGVLADVSRHWPLARPEEGGATIRVQPGITGSRVNHTLRAYGRKIGPDPASINAAMMGGILSNNSSGMCCGVADNSYHTLRYLQFMLPDGTLWDTEDATHYSRFETEHTHLHEGIARLRQRVLADAALVGKIRHKYKIKNTVGYCLNAFIDFEHPLDILAHLLIGAEGTLGFIAGAVLNTIPDKPYKSSALLFFDSPRTACDAIPALKDSGAAALEFMDRAALRSIEELPIAPSFIRDLPEGVSCILCEYQAETAEGLTQQLTRAESFISSLRIVHTTPFTSDEKVQAGYWKLRKGMYPSVAAVREKGTSVMLEDVAVPVERLGEAIEALQELFVQFNYHTAIVFGHAKEGNLHFLVSQSIATAEEIAVFGAFNDALAALIIDRFGGSMKAEHGTGRQVAPYVEAEWGGAAYTIMKELKLLVDPGNILNPGVILNDDKDCHLHHLKSLPVVEEEVDKCVECGYCEQACPSRRYTLTPRQRIVLRRTLSRLQTAGDQATFDAIAKDYQFDGMDTCAVDGMCASDCPVNINTGELIKRLRRENHSRRANGWALLVARRFAFVEWMVKMGLRVGGVFGTRVMHGLTGAIRKVAPAFPLWTAQLTGPIPLSGRGRVSAHATDQGGDGPGAGRLAEQPGAVYFVSCISRMMGRDKESKDSIVDIFVRLAERAKIDLRIPADLGGVCCGQAFSSKGFLPAYEHTVNRTMETLWEWSEQGRLPVVMDISSCTHSLHTSRPYLTAANRERFDKMQIVDSLSYATDVLLPRLTIKRKMEQAVFHPVCSLHKMGIYDKLVTLAKATTEQPVIPFAAGCCGMAGDRGFYYPGLTAAATQDEAAEVKGVGGGSVSLRGNRREKADGAGRATGYYSTGKTCEMALSEAVGKNYRSVLYLLDAVSGD